MRRHPSQKSRSVRTWEVPAAISAAVLLFYADAILTPARAEENWEPAVAESGAKANRNMPGPRAQARWRSTVSTTAGDDVAARVAASGTPAFQGYDEVARFAAPALLDAGSLPPPSPPAQGAWSAIVTGALAPEQPSTAAPAVRGRRVAEQSAPPAPAPGEGAITSETNDAATERPIAAPATVPAAAPASPAAVPAVQRPTSEGSATAPAAAPAPATSATPAASRAGQAKPFDAVSADSTPAQQYCSNIADTATDARAAWQAKKIAEMEAELDKRIADLAVKTEEIKVWLARRDEFSKRAQEKLVGFYTRMRPDASALQLAAMDEETAAAVLTKLDTKVASAVMNEMDPARAARLAAIISGAAKVPPVQPPKSASAPVKPTGEGSAAQPPSRTKS